MIEFSIFPDVQCSSLTTLAMTWPDVVAMLRAPATEPNKIGGKLLKLATFGDIRNPNEKQPDPEQWSLKHDGNLVSVTGIEGEHDAEQMPIAQACALLRAKGIRAVLYTSWSDGYVNPKKSHGGPRWRVLAPLSEPHSPGERYALVARINGVLGGVLSPESFTLSQGYFYGKRPGADYKCLTTFDDADAGEYIDKMDELDDLAIGKSTGSDKTNEPVTLNIFDDAVAKKGGLLGTGDNRRELLKTYLASRSGQHHLPAGDLRLLVRGLAADYFDPDHPVDWKNIDAMVGDFARKDAPVEFDDFSPLFGDTIDADTGELLAAEPVSAEPRDVCLGDLGTFAPQPPKFWVEELIPADVVTLLGAHGGTGKTTLALYGAVCFAMGLPFLGKHSKPAKVLFYSAEDDGAMLRWRLSCVCQRLDVDPAVLSQRLTVVDASECDSVLFAEVSRGGVRSGATTSAFQRLIDRLAACGAQILILDNASDVYGGDENNRGQVRAFIRLLTRLVRPRHGAVLLLAHVDKLTARTGGTQGYSGSTAWHNSVRSRLFLSEDTNGGLLLEHQKSNRGKKAEPLNLVWHDGLPTLVTDMLATALPATEPAARTQVLNLLREFYDRGEFVSTSAQAHNNAFKMLHSERMFPKIKRDTFWQLIRDAEREGLIYRETYRNAWRRESERWRVRALSYVCALSPNTPAHESAQSAPPALSVSGVTSWHESTESTASANDSELDDLFG